MEQIWDRRVRRQGRRRAVAAAVVLVVAMSFVCAAWVGVLYVLLHLPEILGHATGAAVRAYNESVR